MKTQKEIEQLAKAHYSYEYGEDTSITDKRRVGYENGYTQCQEDIGKELEALRAAIRKNTWYDIDGNAQVGLYAIDNNLLNKQD